MKGETKRTMDLRMEPLPGLVEEAEPKIVGVDAVEGGGGDV
jgi:hypothetical protein